MIWRGYCAESCLSLRQSSRKLAPILMLRTPGVRWRKSSTPGAAIRIESARSGGGHCSVIVTVSLMGMMQMALHEIVGMVAVRNCLMSASGGVVVFVVVRAAGMAGAQREGLEPPSASACSSTWPS
jgi:hypothetical protein